MYTLREIANHVAGIYTLMGGSASVASSSTGSGTTVTAGGGETSTSYVTVNMNVASTLSPEQISIQLRDAIENNL